MNYDINCVRQIHNDGYVLAGWGFNYLNPSYTRDLSIIKTNSTGDTLWRKYYDIEDDWGTSILETNDLGYIMCGYTQYYDSLYTITNSKIDLMKTDSAGNVLWLKQYNASSYPFSFGYYVSSTSDGGFIITGSAGDSTNTYVYLIKTDLSGNLLWSQIYGDSGIYKGNCVQQTPDGGYAILGAYQDAFYNQGMYFIKTDSLGNSGCNENSISTVEDSTSASIRRKSTLTIQNGAVSYPTPEISYYLEVNTLCSTVSYCSAMFNLYPDTSVLHHYYAVNMAAGIQPLSYVWSWGDGTYDSIAYPSHLYDSSGYYSICLTITDAIGCTSTYCDSSYLQKDGNSIISIDVIPPGTTWINENNNSTNITVFPNPSSSSFTIKSSQILNNATLTLFNSIGLVVKQIKNICGQTYILQRDNLSTGIYFLQLIQNNKILSKEKLIFIGRGEAF